VHLVGHASLTKVPFEYSNRCTETVFGLLSTHGHDSVRARKYGIANILLTVSTNVTVTTLITFHVLRARRTLAKILPLQDIRLYTGVVAILVESALPPSVFGIVTAALMLYNEALPVPPSEAFMISYYTVTALFYIFCVSPSLQVIFLQRSLVDSLPLDTRTARNHISCHNRSLIYEIPLPLER
jgi:hypothetical protein